MNIGRMPTLQTPEELEEAQAIIDSIQLET